MSAVWLQNYDPLDNLWLSAAIALIPIAFFFLALTKLRLKGYVAATITVGLALAVALLLYKMPVTTALAAAIYGFFYGLWPIAWIILGAVFLYKISVKTGQFDVIRASIVSITPDQRLQLILVGFCFGSFLEGAAGFGAPVAITAALLVGMGFNPLYAAGLCLIANMGPAAFGAMGIPVIVAGQVSGVETGLIGQVIGRQLPLLSVGLVFVLMAIMDGWRGVKETWPAALVAGLTFALSQFLVVTYVGPELPDVISGLVTLLVLALFLKVWKPRHIFKFSNAESGAATASSKDTPEVALSLCSIVKAWSPFILLTIMVTIWSIKPFKALFAPGGALSDWVIAIHVPMLHNLVEKMPPIVGQPTLYGATYNLDLVSATGTAVMIAAILSILLLRMPAAKAVATAKETVKELALPIYSIGMVLAFAFVANYSGLSSTLALAMTKTSHAFTFFSPLLGWVGVFLTGSNTSANALFGALQATTAQQIGVREVLLVAANTTGGSAGKMISPQSIAIACAAVGLVGRESDLFRFTIKCSLTFAIVIGLLVTAQAYWLQWMLP